MKEERIGAAANPKVWPENGHELLGQECETKTTDRYLRIRYAADGVD